MLNTQRSWVSVMLTSVNLWLFLTGSIDSSTAHLNIFTLRHPFVIISFYEKHAQKNSQITLPSQQVGTKSC